MNATRIMDFRIGRISLSAIGLVMVWIAITSAGPFILNTIEWYPHQGAIIPILTIMSVLLLYKGKFLAGDMNIYAILCIQLIFFLLLTVIHNDNYYLTNVELIIGLAILYSFIVSFIGIEKTMKSLPIVMIIIGVLGIVGFIVAITGIIEPAILYWRSEHEPVYTYFVTFTNTVYGLGFGRLIRVGGFFNEGGTLGFYLIHALILNKVYFRNRKIEMLLILSGILTISFAFYISLLLYTAFFYLRTKYLLYLLLAVIAVLILFLTVNYFKSDNILAEYIYDLIFRRFEINEELGLQGNNRAVFIEEAMPSFLVKPFFGHGIDYVMEYMPISNASYMGPLVAYGMIGCMLYFLHVLYLGTIACFNSGQKILLIKSFVILALNYLQRPFVMSLFSYVCIILLAEAFRRQRIYESTAVPRGVN